MRRPCTFLETGLTYGIDKHVRFIVFVDGQAAQVLWEIGVSQCWKIIHRCPTPSVTNLWKISDLMIGGSIDVDKPKSNDVSV